MRRPSPRPQCLIAALALVGCSRDLDLPGAVAFTVSASPTTVAPRQTSTLTITGGTGDAAGFTVDFDAGGKLSGDDATVVNNGDGTATYRAGRNGSTQDTVVVRDASGAERTAIITVGARISVTPQAAATAPGGSLIFVASGGKSPYSFSVAGGPGAAISSDPMDGTRGIYVAGTTGDTEELVTVSDSTGDPAASVTAYVRVGTGLQLYRTSTGTVAPGEHVPVVAIGGRPPYTYGPPWDSVLGGFQDPSKGVFTVGTQWSPGQQAVAEATDENGQSAQLVMDVGPPLEAALANPSVRPGVANRIEAAGGKGPYAFRFARHGNHSHGEVDAISGVYVPGPSPGALDRLQVQDATGTVVEVAGTAPVGPIELTTGSNGERCVAGDYDGDGLEDLAFLFRGMSLLEVNRAASSAALYRSYYVGQGFRFPSVFAADHAGLGRSDLLFLGRRDDGPTWFDGIADRPMAFWALRPDMTGLFANPDGIALPPLIDGAQGTTLRDTGSSTTRYVTNCGSCSPGLCAAAWTDGSSLPVTNSCTGALANPAALGSAIALLGGDFSGDGLADLAWVSGSTDPVFANTWNSPGPIHLRTRSGADFADAGSLALPSGTTYIGEGNGEQGRILRVPAKPGQAANGLLIRLRDDTTGRGVLAFATGSPLAWRFQRLDPFAGKGTGTGATSLALFTPAPGGPPLVAALSGSDGTVAVLDPWATTPSAASAADVTFPASFACPVDADADGFDDLAVGGERSTMARLLWGDGRGGFGTRPRLDQGSFLLGGSGDLDGDGLTDLVAADDSGLYAMFGDAGQLGWGETAITSLQVVSAVVAPFASYGPEIPSGTQAMIFQTIDGDYYDVRAAGGGTFLDPTPLPVTTGGQIVPRVPHEWMVAADLGGHAGGDAVGPDLIALKNDNYGNSWVHVLLRGSAGAEEHMSPPVGEKPASIEKTHQCAYAAVNDASSRHAVAALCAFEVPAGQPAAAWGVKGWPLDWSNPSWFDALWTQAGALQPGGAGSETTMAAIGTSVDAGGKGIAWFAVATDKLLVVKVDPGTNALDPATWTVTATQVAASRKVEPLLSVMADFDGDGRTDAVVGGFGMTTVLKNTGSDAAPVFAPVGAGSFEVPAAGIPVLAGPLGFAAGGATPAGPSVVLLGLTGGGLQLLGTDGAGGLR